MNFRIHVLAALAASGLGLAMRLSRVEMLLLASAIALVLILETINTAIETLIDAVTMERSITAGYAKDAAAATVLLAALYSLGVGWYLFFPRLREIPAALVAAFGQRPAIFALWVSLLFWVALECTRPRSGPRQ